MFHANNHSATLQHEPLARRARARLVRGLAQRLRRAVRPQGRRRTTGTGRHSIGTA